jgi:hypothetical protein
MPSEGPYSPGPYNPENIPIDNALPRTDFPAMRRSPDPRPRANPWRALSAAIGVLLFLSAFLLPHTLAERVNVAVGGLVILALSLVAMRWPTVRWFTAVAAVWLVTSTIGLAGAGNDAASITAVATAVVFLLSLAPGPGETTAPRRTQQVA